MKAVVFHDVGDIRLDDVPAPKIQDPRDAIVRITTSAICGTDLHMIRGTMPGMEKVILGHEGVGVIEEVGDDVENFIVGDRVVIPSTIACGECEHCQVKEYAQCDRANPNGPEAGTAFYGGPKTTGPFDGLQAEKARIPYADVGLVKIPDSIPDDQAIFLSDILPTAYMAAEMADIYDGDIVAVFGCGPVGLLTILCAQVLGAGKVIAIDTIGERLKLAESLGAETIDFNKNDPVKKLKELTEGFGPDRVIDAVGVDANQPNNMGAVIKEVFNPDQLSVAPKQNPDGKNWKPGNAPFQVLDWAVQAVKKSGTISIIGVYPQNVTHFPIGMMMNKNLTVRGGNCNHRKYIPMLIEMIQSGEIDPSKILTQSVSLESAIPAYRAFDRREEKWIKVDIKV